MKSPATKTHTHTKETFNSAFITSCVGGCVCLKLFNARLRGGHAFVPQTKKKNMAQLNTSVVCCSVLLMCLLKALPRCRVKGMGGGL